MINAEDLIDAIASGTIFDRQKHNAKRLLAEYTEDAEDTPIFPIVYKKGNQFEVSPVLIPGRNFEIWGYEIMPNLFVSKHYGSVGWRYCNAYAGEMYFNGKRGSLPKLQFLNRHWKLEIKEKIEAMGKFLLKHGVSASVKKVGSLHCYDAAIKSLQAPKFNLANGGYNVVSKMIVLEHFYVGVHF